MVFHSFDYVVFFLLVLAVCRCLPHRPQNWFLLAASYFFYGYITWWWVLLILTSSIADYTAARGIERHPDRRKWWLALSLTVNFGILGVFKYFDFFTTSAAAAFRSLGVEVHPLVLNLALPAGISFHTFQSVGYVVEVYRGRLKARRSLPDYLLFTSLFPQLVAGPIDRAGNLLAQVERPRVFDARVARAAVLLILWGYFKKLAIADNAAPLVNRVFSLNEPAFPVLWAGVLAFGVQIYADFSAYTDIARGCARLLGFELCPNFRHPYLADSPQDFWRRWHMSLSTWFRDYVYIPLGGSRGGLALTCRNLLVTFFLSGLWHGAAWNFILWGLWHGGLLVLWTLWNRAPENARPDRLPKAARVALTFVLIHIGWLMFREHSLPHLWRHLTLNPFAATGMDWRVGAYFATQAVLLGLPLWIHPAVEKWLERRHPAAIAEGYPGWGWTLAQTAAAAVIYTGLILFRSPNTSDFIYFAF